MIRDLASLLGRRLSFAVVPNWYGEWPLASDPGYCRFVRENSDELLLHGYFHHRRQGNGPVTMLTNANDEMNGLDAAQTEYVLDCGQRVFIEAFGEPARGFIAPAWQRGHVRPGSTHAPGLEYVLGFFSLESDAGRQIPLATSTWDCGRWRWLGHIGHGIGSMLQFFDRVPVLAIHPRDLDRGFWPAILRRTRELIDNGFEPSTPAALLQAVARPGSQGRSRELENQRALRRTAE
jgi:hypothetical protein